MVSELPDVEFRSIADDLPVMAWRSDQAGSCDWANNRLLKFKGRALSEELGEGWRHTLHPEEHDDVLAAFSNGRSSRMPYKKDLRLRRHDGVFRWMSTEGHPVFRGGDFAGFLNVHVDVTEHRETEDTLRGALDERELLLREVHHRVKNNLQTLMALIRFMRRGATADARDVLDVLNVRLSTMATVQNYLHGAESLMRVPARALFDAILPELADLQLGVVRSVERGDVDLHPSGQEAAYLGLAVSESILVLAQSGCTGIRVAIGDVDGLPAVIVNGLGGAAAQLATELGLRLVRQYARGAGASVDVLSPEGGLRIVLSFSADVARR